MFHNKSFRPKSGPRIRAMKIMRLVVDVEQGVVIWFAVEQ